MLLSTAFSSLPIFPISYTNKETELNLTASAMASSSMAVSLSLSYSPFYPRRTPPPRCSVHLAPLSSMASSLKLSSSHCISSFGLAVLPRKLSSISPSPSGGSNTRSLTIVSAKGYKMKTHKASAKRFRVTGTGKIVRRRAGKQHLLYKKNTKRKLRLSKMHPVSRSDYDNVVGCLPYLKVNRKAT